MLPILQATVILEQLPSLYYLQQQSRSLGQRKLFLSVFVLSPYLETLLKYQTRSSIRLPLLAGIFTALPWLTGVIFTFASQSS
jgi:hypothetical protein